MGTASKELCCTLWSRQPLTDSSLSDCECNNSTNNLSSAAAELALNPLPLSPPLKATAIELQSFYGTTPNKGK